MSSAEGQRSLFRAAGTVGFFTLISRIFGFLRDMAIANYFGSRSAADVFFLAFRIPNLLRRLTAEGALSAAFVPLFAKTLLEDRQKAVRFANNLLVTLTLFLILVVVAGIVLAPLILKVIAIGYTGDAEKFQLTVLLTRLLFPYLLFISLAAALMGILNTLDHFAAPAASPVVLNVSIILCAIFLRDTFDLPVYSLVAGVLIGGVCQLAIQIPFAIRKGFTFAFVFDPASALLKKTAWLILPAVFGIGVAEINMFVDTMLATMLKEGSISFLYYSNRLVQFPLGVFAIAMSTALLPKLSFQAGKNDTSGMIDSLSKTMKMGLLLILPSTVGLIVLREPIIELIFERGEFDHYATVNTGIALAYYSVGLIAFAGVKFLVSAFYALGDTKTPVKVASVAMILNIILNLLLMGPLEHGGLALATSISSAINFLVLFFLLRSRLGGIDGARIFKSFVILLIASLAMGGGLYYGWDVFFGSGYTVVGLALAIASAAALYFLLAFLSGVEEARDSISAIKRKLIG